MRDLDQGTANPFSDHKLVDRDPQRHALRVTRGIVADVQVGPPSKLDPINSSRGRLPKLPVATP